MVDANNLAVAGCKYIGTSYTKIDCQAFVEKCLKDCGDDTNLAGSNTWYREIAKNGWVGTPEECRKKYGTIPKGAFIFIQVNNGKEPEKYRKDGIGNVNHIGIYTGMTGAQMCEIARLNGVSNVTDYNFGSGAIHSSMSKGHVCTSNFAGKSIDGGWNRIGLWNRVDYHLDGAEPAEGETMEHTAQVVTSGGILNLRAKKDKDSTRLAQIPNGDQLTVLEDDGRWSRIEWNGKKGFVMSAYLKQGEIIPGAEDFEVPEGYVLAKKDELERAYNIIGDLLGMRG